MTVTFATDPKVATAESASEARPTAKVATARPTPQKAAEPTPQSQVSHNLEETNVIFRRDSNGQIYYVFTDAQSGRELQELPPKQVRAVGQGIADLVKELQEKNSSHIEVKG